MRPKQTATDTTPTLFATNLFSKSFSWFIRGRKRFVTIPLTLFAILFIFFPSWRDNVSKSYSSVLDFFDPKTFITKSELDVLNEWVIVIWSYDDLDLARSEFKDFVVAYGRYGDSSLTKDIHLVRSCERKKSWMIVIDYGDGKQSEAQTANHITMLKQQLNAIRDTRNNLGQMLDDCYPVYYAADKFEYHNGAIINIRNRSLFQKK